MTVIKNNDNQEEKKYKSSECYYFNSITPCVFITNMTSTLLITEDIFHYCKLKL